MRIIAGSDTIKTNLGYKGEMFMQAGKVLVTPRSFGRNSSEPVEMLSRNGLEVVMNPYGRILTKEEMCGLIADVDAVIVGVDPLDRDVLARAPKLKVISKYGVGTDNIDLAYAAEAGIAVEVAAGANTEAVADFTFALMLGAARRMTMIDRGCRRRDWSKMTTVDMYGKTLGLVGLGNIGKAVARRAHGFNMSILAYDLFRDPDYALANGIVYVDELAQLLQEADFISLHLPLTEHTAHMVGAEAFGLMKPTAVLVNTARGGLIDEDALCDALASGRIWGAGIDVFEQEPPDNSRLLEIDNLIIGSHCAASTLSAVDNMGLMAARNIIRNLII